MNALFLIGRNITLLLALLAFPHEAKSAGGTVVTVNGPAVTITVRINLCCLHDAVERNILQPLALVEIARAQAMWNDGLAKFQARSCYDINIIFDIRILSRSSREAAPPWEDGYHRLVIDFDQPGTSNVFDPESGDPNEDTISAYRLQLNGTWYFSSMTPRTWAHEIGHLLGLGDDYYHRDSMRRMNAGARPYTPLPGRSGTLMGDGDAVDQNLADRLADLMIQAGLLSPCAQWEGRIEVSNVFAGRTLAMDVHGRHNWRGNYRMKFRELPTTRSVSDASGRQFALNAFVPVEMSYAIQADHHHDYDHKWGDVILRGQATGKLTGRALKDALIGSVLRFEAAAPARDSAPPAPPGSFASWREFQDFMGAFHTAPRPGCYQLSIAFGGRGQPPNELRALYNGIDRSGSSPIHPGPDADFLRVMPSHMPDGTNVLGCLETPEQRDVKGEHTYPYADPGPLNSTEQISIKWSFVRTLCRDAVTCWPASDNASAPSNSDDGQTSGPPSGEATSDPVAGAAIVAPAATPPNVPTPNAPRGGGSGFLRP
ncbi:MAG TPA: hypothetical protein VFK79_01425 [Xanthobacteraceae bacterium]|nr:hypothetical protein [Xanthobacteraceae bacterium]